MTTRIYVVLEKDGPTRLVEAGTAAQAIRHCVRNRYSAHAATPKDMAAVMSRGVTVERAENESQAIPANEKTINEQTGANV